MNARSFPVAFFFLLVGHTLCAQTPTVNAPALNIGWYNGDCKAGIPAQANWYVSDQQFSRTFDNFVVPDSGWTVASLYSLNSMSVSNITQASWEIRSGISAGNGGVLVASGKSTATQKLLYTLPDGENIYQVEVDDLSVQLQPGAYWLNVSPVLAEWSPAAAGAPSYVCATTGANAAGNPPGNDGNAFYNSVAPPQTLFQPVRNTGGEGTSGDFSHGVLISAGMPAPPVVSAVVSAASWQSGAVSPGELIAIAGNALGPVASATLTLDSSGNVSRSLNGVQVLFNGISAPLIYAGVNQINAVVPYELAGASNPSLQIRTAAQTSAVFPLKIAPAAPALFTSDGSGTGPAAALNQDSSYNSPAHPAAAGSYVALFMTGEGLTNSAVTGAITTVASTPPLTPQPLLSPLSVLIGGKPAVVSFYGEAPGLVSGVLQINVQIPADSPSGNVPISFSLGGFATQNGVTVSVR